MPPLIDIRNDSATAELTVGSYDGLTYFRGAGTTRVTGTMSGPIRFFGDEGLTMIVDTPHLGTSSLSFVEPTTVHWAQNSLVSRAFLGTATFAVVENNDDVVVGTNYGMAGTPTDRITVVDSPDGSTGTMIIEPDYMYANGLEIETNANSIVQFNRNQTNGILYSDNAGISGAGSLWKSDAATIPVEREMTYTGRTMLSGGSMQLNEVTVDETTHRGALPSGTVVEIAEGASLDLNGLDQTVGGLTDWTGRFQDQVPTAGEVLLNGATLTIDAETSTTFSGSVVGEGALVKEGAETFTLVGDYTNPDGRTLRVEAGLFAVDGDLDVTAGVFELAGGQTTATNLLAAGTEWGVTLNADNDGQTLVDIVSNADITDAVLLLALADGYTPIAGESYTLLTAEMITGASQGGALFQYTDGDIFSVGGVDFEISWQAGSENVVLTAIPEPGSVALVFAMVGLGGAVFLKRRR